MVCSLNLLGVFMIENKTTIKVRGLDALKSDPKIFDNDIRVIFESYIDMQCDVEIKAAKSIFADAISQMTLYFNVVMAVGYAGYFALLSNMNGKILSSHYYFSGFLVSVSLTSFVFFEVYKMIYHAYYIADINDKLENKFMTNRENVIYMRKKSIEFNVSMRRWWFICLLISVVCGFIGAIVMVVSFLIHGMGLINYI